MYLCGSVGCVSYGTRVLCILTVVDLSGQAGVFTGHVCCVI